VKNSRPESPRQKDQSQVIQNLGLAVMKLPHLRVGQLIENAVDTYRREHDLSLTYDMFYIEDAQMADALLWYAENYGRESL